MTEKNLAELNQGHKSRNLNILVVDDEPGYRELLTFQLKMVGLQAEAAENAIQALGILHSAKYNLIVTDIRMPGGIDGIDFIQSYRQQKPDQKVIFITGFAAEKKLADSLEFTNTKCLHKPFEVDEFLLAVRQLLWSEDAGL